MRRAGRILLNAVTILSMFLFLEVGGTNRQFGPPRHRYFVVTSTGEVHFGVLGESWHTVPSYIPRLIFGLLPGVRLAVFAVRRHLRAKAEVARRVAALKGVCVACGYDLRATPEQCPECGTVPAGANGNAEAQRRRAAEKAPSDGGAE